MRKLKLSAIVDEKPIKITVTLSAALHRNLVIYAELLSHESGNAVEPSKLITPMLDKFIASDRIFQKRRRGNT